MSRARDLLARPAFVRWAVVVAALLSSPALFHGFEVDDRLQRQGALGQTTFGETFGHGAFDLFTFLDGDPRRTMLFMEHGLGAWWSDPNARIAFLRPISSALMYFDYHVLRHAVLIHVHSIAWYALAVALAGLLYRHLINKPWVAGLAALMFAVDHSHGLLASWIAQRNALVAGAFSLCALLFQHHRRAWLAALSFGLALFSAEAALGVIPYLVAYALFLDERRLRSLLPYTAPLLVWFVVYKLGHHGVSASGLYVDPAHQPVQFLKNAAAHAPVLVATELGMPATDVYAFLPWPAKAAVVVVSVLLIVAFARAIAPLFRRDPSTRFFVTGAVLSVLPACAAIPGGRLTFFASFGIVGALAQLLGAWHDGEWAPRRLELPVVYWSGLGHVFLSPLAFLLAMNQMTMLDQLMIRNANGVPNVPELAHQRLVVVNAPDATFLAYLGIILADRGDYAPERILAMAAGVRPLELVRVDDHTLLLSSPIALVQPGTDLLARAATPFAVGYRVVFSDVTIEITKIDRDGWPTEARFTFASPLDGPALRFMQWKDQTLAPLTLPANGGRVTFPAQQVQLF